jgi:Domain of unknown function (DUF4124)
MIRSSSGSIALTAVSCLLLLAYPLSSSADFYRWIDAQGNRRISNIPPTGIRADGKVVPEKHPNSLAAQQARLRAKVAAEEHRQEDTPIAPEGQTE